MKKSSLLAYKCAILEDGLDQKANHAHWLNFKFGDETAKNAFIDEFGEETYKIACNLNKARDKRKKRVIKRFDGLLDGNDSSKYKIELVFVTLTFRDSTFERSTYEKRRRYVSRWCKRYCGIYVANVDYGDKNRREHYHVLSGSTISKKARENWSRYYGSIDFEKVRSSKGDKVASVKYLLKLTNHAIKQSTTTGGYVPRLIYSRGINAFIDFNEVF